MILNSCLIKQIILASSLLHLCLLHLRTAEIGQGTAVPGPRSCVSISMRPETASVPEVGTELRLCPTSPLQVHGAGGALSGWHHRVWLSSHWGPVSVCSWWGARWTNTAFPVLPSATCKTRRAPQGASSLRACDRGATSSPRLPAAEPVSCWTAFAVVPLVSIANGNAAPGSELAATQC